MGEGCETYPVRLCVVASDVCALFARDLTAPSGRHQGNGFPYEVTPGMFC
jgi:hypothetical protein